MTLHDSKEPINIFEALYIFLINALPRNTQLRSTHKSLPAVANDQPTTAEVVEGGVMISAYMFMLFK